MDASDNNDKNKVILVTDPKGQLVPVSLEHIKNTYICEGLTAEELSLKFNVPVPAIQKYIQENELDKLRAAHIKHGLAKLQNIQLGQADKLMNLESQFKRMRIVQLEKMLEDYAAYYSKYGHFYKVHPITEEILKDTNGIPIHIRIPDIAKEIRDLKESVSLSEGMKMILGHIDDIINKPKDVENLDKDIIDVTNYNDLFSKKKSEDR